MISGAKLFRAGLFLALLVVGMYLLLKPPQLITEAPTSTANIGTLNSNGPFWLRQNGDLRFLEVKGTLPAAELQTLRTPSSTQVHVELDGGSTVLVGESTLAILDRTDEGFEVLVFDGAAQVLEQGEDPVSVIHSKLKKWSQEEVRQSEKLMEPAVEEESAKVNAAPASGTLTDEYIQEVLGRQQRFLRSCFIKYFQRKNGQIQSGRVMLHLFIESSGKVQSTSVVSSEIEDEGYLSCLQSVAQRTRFRTFDGPPLSVQYPIDLTL